MRVLVLGDPSQKLDEGAKNVANYLTRFLRVQHDVLQLHQREVMKPSLLAKVLRHRPQAIVSAQGPSAKTIVLLALLRLLTGFPRTVVVGAQPSPSGALRWAMKLLPPTAVFAQSTRWIERFAAMGVRAERLPNGVNVEKFSPDADPAALAALRAELGLAADRPIALHIGPINRNRNHELLARLARETEWQVLVIGSETAPYVPEVAQMLTEAGVVLVRRYLPDINLVYALADVYVFPVVDPTGSIEFPLTVLEAMACDRPVATTRFLALPEYLEEGPAFAWFDGYDALLAALARVRGRSGNRAAAEAFAWPRVVARVERHFSPVGAA